MMIRTPSSPDMNVCPISEKNRAPDTLCALVRLLARHAAAETVGHIETEQTAGTAIHPNDTGAISDV